MLKKIKSVVLIEPGNIFIKDISYPKKPLDHVMIKVESVGICGSDIGAYRGTNPLVTYPRIIGHEIVGTIIETGEGLPENTKNGDRVIVDPYIYCGTCYPCSIGRTNCCESLKVIGVHINGGMQEICSHPAKLVHKIPNDFPVEQAPLIEPLTIALHALHRAKLQPGEHVVIIGAGAIGLMAALVAMQYKAIPILVDIIDSRLQHALACGIPWVFNPEKDNVKDEVSSITRGRMAEVVVEASGANQSIQATLDYVSFSGRISLTGWPKEATQLKTNIITFKELDIRGARTSAGEFQEAIELLYSKKIDSNVIISKTITLEEIPDMIKELSEHPDKHLKINAIL